MSLMSISSFNCHMFKTRRTILNYWSQASKYTFLVFLYKACTCMSSDFNKKNCLCCGPAVFPSSGGVVTIKVNRVLFSEINSSTGKGTLPRPFCSCLLKELLLPSQSRLWPVHSFTFPLQLCHMVTVMASLPGARGMSAWTSIGLAAKIPGN